jgi:hypothetical protein
MTRRRGSTSIPALRARACTSLVHYRYTSRQRHSSADGGSHCLAQSKALKIVVAIVDKSGMLGRRWHLKFEQEDDEVAEAAR